MSKMLNFPPVAFVSVPLDVAVLCVNCNTVSNSGSEECGVCGSSATLRLSLILNREPQPPNPPATVKPVPTTPSNTSATSKTLELVKPKPLAFVPRVHTA